MKIEFLEADKYPDEKVRNFSQTSNNPRAIRVNIIKGPKFKKGEIRNVPPHIADYFEGRGTAKKL